MNQFKMLFNNNNIKQSTTIKTRSSLRQSVAKYASDGDPIMKRQSKQTMDEKTLHQYETRSKKQAKKEMRAFIVSQKAEEPYIGMDFFECEEDDEDEPQKKRRRIEVSEVRPYNLRPYSPYISYREYNEDLVVEQDDNDSSSDYESDSDNTKVIPEPTTPTTAPLPTTAPPPRPSYKIPSDYHQVAPRPNENYEKLCFAGFMKEKMGKMDLYHKTDHIKEIATLCEMFKYLCDISDWLHSMKHEMTRLCVTIYKKCGVLLGELTEFLISPKTNTDVAFLRYSNAIMVVLRLRNLFLEKFRDVIGEV